MTKEVTQQYVSADCSCGDWSVFHNQRRASGFDRVNYIKTEFQNHLQKKKDKEMKTEMNIKSQIKSQIASTSLYCNKIGCKDDGEASYGVDTIFGVVWFCSPCAKVIQDAWSGRF